MDTKIIQTVIICITLIELWALSLGINGILLTTVVGVLAALAGLSRPIPKFMRDMKGGIDK